MNPHDPSTYLVAAALHHGTASAARRRYELAALGSLAHRWSRRGLNPIRVTLLLQTLEEMWRGLPSIVRRTELFQPRLAVWETPAAYLQAATQPTALDRVIDLDAAFGAAILTSTQKWVDVSALGYDLADLAATLTNAG